MGGIEAAEHAVGKERDLDFLDAVRATAARTVLGEKDLIPWPEARRRLPAHSENGPLRHTIPEKWVPNSETGCMQSSQTAGRRWNTSIAICQRPENRSRREVHNRYGPVCLVFAQPDHLARDPSRIYAALDGRAFCPKRAPTSGQYPVAFIFAP